MTVHVVFYHVNMKCIFFINKKKKIMQNQLLMSGAC